MMRCDCLDCLCRRWAMRLFVGFVVALFVIALAVRPAHARDVDLNVCGKIVLPGPEHTLNPHDPPEKQRQEIVTVCETIKVPDPLHIQTRFEPVTDRKHDPRSFA